MLDSAPPVDSAHVSGALTLAARAGVVSHALLLQLVQATPPSHEFQRAVSAAMAASKSKASGAAHHLMDDIAAALASQAKTHLPATSRVTVQLDSRLAHDTKAMVARAKALRAACAAAGLKPGDVLVRIPATYEGIAATKELEGAGINVLLSGVYSLAQGIAGIDAGASVVHVGSRKLAAWYTAHPNVHASPLGGQRGTRADAGSILSTAQHSDETAYAAGRDLVAAVHAYKRQRRAATVIMAPATSAEEVRALAGCDLLVVPPHVVIDLEESHTLAGYNDGLSAISSTDADDALSPLERRLAERMPNISTVMATTAAAVQGASSATAFAAEVGKTSAPGMELTNRDVNRDAAAAAAFERSISKMSNPTGGV